MPANESDDSNPTDVVPASETVKLKKNGEIIQDQDGVKVVVAKFTHATGRLEFANPKVAEKLKVQILSAVGTIEKGTKPSGLIVKSMGLMGVKADAPKNVPTKPRRHPMMGDQTPDLVEWYFAYYPQEAYIRYGVFLDAAGKPIRKNVRRRLTELVDDRSGEMGLAEQNEGKGQKVGKNKWEKSDIAIQTTEEILKNQMIARRATCMTFQPNEVIGGFNAGDDEESHDGADEEQQLPEEGGDA